MRSILLPQHLSPYFLPYSLQDNPGASNPAARAEDLDIWLWFQHNFCWWVVEARKEIKTPFVILWSMVVWDLYMHLHTGSCEYSPLVHELARGADPNRWPWGRGRRCSSTDQAAKDRACRRRGACGSADEGGAAPRSPFVENYIFVHSPWMFVWCPPINEHDSLNIHMGMSQNLGAPKYVFLTKKYRFGAPI